MQIKGGAVVRVVMDGVAAWKGWLKLVLYLIVDWKCNSKLGVASTLSAFCLCRVVRFRVCANLSLAQLVNVSPRFFGPYKTGAGVNDVWSNRNLCVLSRVLLLVGGFWLCIAGSMGPLGPL